MSTPTEPTHPQPKPAGLRTCFHCGTDLSSLPDDVFCPKCLPLPTPHAAEAGGEQFSIADDAQALCYAIEAAGASEALTMCSVLASRLLARCRNELPARHRTAAENVGTGGDWPFPYECEKCGRTYADPDHLGTPWQCECGGALKTLPKLYPTPPATQSALEQAREALGKALDWATGEGAYTNGRDNLTALAEDVVPACDTALAALNAVLPPAKGGDGV